MPSSVPEVQRRLHWHFGPTRSGIALGSGLLTSQWNVSCARLQAPNIHPRDRILYRLEGSGLVEVTGLPQLLTKGWEDIRRLGALAQYTYCPRLHQQTPRQNRLGGRVLIRAGYTVGMR